uniref:NADH-ubiquinone oxidoreductase chain 1 n=1 Tax=Pneumocystis oryctolagi TaxID=42067 RepID=A0A8A6W3W5_9ASCO|nr:NADH dehydrogenase subunit 1 [Pneumocystis oryctolagi]QTK22312.1 NADH dehydrogenase subunit 1 [Pneumocystis oryctolagi]
MLNFLQVLLVLLPVLLNVAFITLAERKVMGSMQRRIGPNSVGYYGLLQPVADALKLLLKETIIPSQANKILFFLSPLSVLICALLGWAIIPWNTGVVLWDWDLGVLYSLAISSLGIYGILVGGWSSNSKYALLGSLRSTAQLISYELLLTSIVFVIVLFAGTLNYTQLIENQKAIWWGVPLLPLFLLYFIGALAETNRAPFDLPEAESELVAGFMTEYSAAIFVYFFLAEYANIILLSTFSVLFFWGGYLFPFSEILGTLFSSFLPSTLSSFFQGTFSGLVLGIKTALLVFFFIWVRASFPRIRYDQLMTVCWTVLLPLLFAWIFLIIAILYSFNGIPTIF